MITTVIDFETNYTKDVFSVSDMGEWNYMHDPRFDAYLVGIAGSDGLRWAGHPGDFNWESIKGNLLVAHNARFDQSVAEAIAEQGVIPKWVAEADWSDTADLAAYLLSGRSLAEASATLLGPQDAVDKKMRNYMSGRTWADAVREGKAEELTAYALNDAVKSLQIWEKYSSKWPLFEQRLSAHTRLMTRRGITVDVPELKRVVADMEEVVFDCTAQLPWVKAGHPAQSAAALKAECRKQGFPAPVTTADDDPPFEAWMVLWGPKAPFIAAFKQLKKVNSHLGRLETMLAGARKSDNRWGYGLKYFGATPTGRWAGAAGANVQNMPRDLILDTHDVRGLHIPKPGHSFVICDYSSIEPVVTGWYTGDTEMLTAFKNGDDIYEAYARGRGLYKKPEPLKDHKALRNKIKMAVLSCCYGVGAGRLSSQYPDISLPDAEKLVAEYRRTNPRVLAMWRRFDGLLQLTVSDTADPNRKLEIELPSGRTLTYFKVVKRAGQFLGQKTLGVRALDTSLYGGKLFNALIQGTARDLLAEAVLRVEAAGYPVVLHVHDEIVCEVPTATAKADAVAIQKVMQVSPPWALTLPLRAEPVIAQRYAK